MKMKMEKELKWDGKISEMEKCRSFVDYSKNYIKTCNFIQKKQLFI